MDLRLYTSLFWSFILLLAFAPHAASSDEVSVITSDRAGLYFQITLDPLHLSSSVESDSLSGYHALLTVGIPTGAQVEVTSAEVRSRIAASKVLAATDISGVVRPLVEVSEPFTVRGRQMVTLRINPLSPDGLCVENVAVRLTFRGGAKSGATASDPWFDRVFGARIVNFDAFKSWPTAAPAPKSAAVSGPFADGGTWYKVAVNQTGLCRIYGSQLAEAGLSLNGLASSTLRLYTGGGAPLPYDNTTPRPTFDEVAVLVEDGGDGSFGATDYVLFFAEGPDRWQHAPGSAGTFVNHHYSDRTVYWLTVGGQGVRMALESVDPTSPADTTITSFRRTVHVEQDNLLRQFNDGKILDYYSWYWTKESPAQLFIPASGYVSGTAAELRSYGRTFDPDFDDPLVGYMEVTANGQRAVPIAQNQFYCQFTVTNLLDGLNNIRLNMWGASDVAPYLNYVDLTYQSRLVPMGSSLDLPLGGSTLPNARLEVVDSYGQSLVALRIDNPRRPVRLDSLTRAGGTLDLVVDLTPTGPNRFFFGASSAAFAPIAIERTTPVDLYAVGEQIDGIIITSQQLAPGLAEYIDLWEGRGINLRTVTVDDIMDNFAFGLYDPTAIRDFLKYAYENYPSPAPHTALLVGDGSFDYLDNLRTGMSNVVPPFVLPSDLDESASDDNYVYFGRYGIVDSDTSYAVPPDRGLDMVIARWPVRTAAEIGTIVEKTRRYESPATYGPWRSKITLVADDERGGTYANETFHVAIGAEPLDRSHIPQTFRREKIYLWDYPRVGRLKPSVNDAIVRSVNEGTLLIDYIGHGNPDVWADERVFYRDADLPRLQNADRLPLFYAASCAIGFFDDPAREGMAEELLVYPNGGAIAIISAMRLVYASENSTFNRKVFDILLTADSLSMAEAFFVAKLERQYNGGTIPVPNTNDRAYLFFGDPFLRLGLPHLRVEFDEAPDSLMALGRTLVSGRVVDHDGVLRNADGRLLIDVYDSNREKQFRLFNTSGQVISTVNYTLPGPTIYRGTATITNGEFSFEFVTPLDVGYGGTGARIMAYAELTATDGIGAVDSLPVSGAVAPTTDSAGPEITYGFPNIAGFSDGGTVTAEDVLRIGLADSSGINLAGGLGHGITLLIDDRPEQMVDLTGLYAAEQDDFTRGGLDYRLEGLEPGRHTFKIKAWDNANNSSTVEFAAEVVAAGGTVLADLLNYPNPMQESTRFSYRLTAGVQRVSLEIFTLSGRRIRSFDRYPTDPGYYDDIIWYGDDYAGDRVATGVYIFKATAYPAGGEAVESFGKVILVN